MSFCELIIGHGAYLVGDNLSADRILDVRNGTLHRNIEIAAILKHTVTRRINRAVFKRKVVGIAEQLLPAEMATHKLNVLRMPGNVLTIDLRIIDRHVLALPERVFRSDAGIVHLHILAILEDVLRIRCQPVDVDMVGVHEGISTLMKRHVLDLHIVNMPECRPKGDCPWQADAAA